MQFIDIESRDNPKIKSVHKLMTSGRFRKENGLFAVEGLRLCVDAMNSGYKTRDLYFTDKMYEKNSDYINKLSENSECSYKVAERLFSVMSNTVTPQGVICVIEFPKETLLIRRGGKYIFLENLSDPSNLGAVSRTAEALGIDGIITSGGCDIFNPKAVRASMGALIRFPVKTGNFNDMINEIKENMLPVFATVPRDSDMSLCDCDFSAGGVALIGNEALGLSKKAIDICDKKITIPMRGRAESLNASVSAAIVCYEMMKN